MNVCPSRKQFAKSLSKFFVGSTNMSFTIQNVVDIHEAYTKKFSIKHSTFIVSDKNMVISESNTYTLYCLRCGPDRQVRNRRVYVTYILLAWIILLLSTQIFCMKQQASAQFRLLTPNDCIHSIFARKSIVIFRFRQ